jgi:acyl-CoA dehydrogenase
LDTSEQMQELEEIRGLAREFAAAELRPHAEAWDTNEALGETVRAQLAELGFIGMLVPEAGGGMGFDAPVFAAAIAELAWGEASAATAVAEAAVAAAVLHAAGHDLLGSVLGGSAHVALAGLADGGAEWTARQTGADWTLSGGSGAVIEVAGAAGCIVAARAEADGALHLFLLPADVLAGAQRSRTIGLRGLHISTVEFEALEVPATARLEMDATSVLEMVVLARLAMAAVSAGIAQAALDHAREYAGEREQFGRALRRFEGIQQKLAGMQDETAAARALLMESARAPTPHGAAGAKRFASATAMRVTTEAVQVFGGYGYMRDYPVEKLMRDAKATEILGGLNETLAQAVSAGLFRD